MAVQPFEVGSNRTTDAMRQGRQLLSGFSTGQKTITVLFGVILLLIIYALIDKTFFVCRV